MKIKNTLEKPAFKRSKEELTRCTDFISKIDFFEQKKIPPDDLYEIVSSFKFVVTKPGEDVFNYGDTGDLFYIIVKGSVAVMIPNPRITNWKRERKELEVLEDWVRKLEVKQTKIVQE